MAGASQHRGRRRRIRTVSAGIVVVRADADCWRLLLLRAYRYWDFPKGRVEAGETRLQAAQRETAEEAGITDLAFDWGEAHLETGPYGNGKLADYYIAATQSREVVMGIAPELGRPEHDEYRWIDFAAAYRLCSPRVRGVVHWAENLVTGTPRKPPEK